MAGLLRGAGLNVSSNRENGLGRPDLVCTDMVHKRALIIELKVAQEYEDLDRRAFDELGQIEEKKYGRGLPPRIVRVVKYAIAFWKKECCA